MNANGSAYVPDPGLIFEFSEGSQTMLTVAIFDANAISRNLLGTVLTNGGYHVVGDANTSSAAFARVFKLRPQIVCIDTGPVESDAGMAMLDTIRSALPKTMVFMVSGNMSAASVQGAVQRGVHGFIVKPFNSATVLTTIRNAVIKFAKQQGGKADD